MALTLYRAWGIKPHELDSVPADVVRLTNVALLAGLFDEKAS